MDEFKKNDGFAGETMVMKISLIVFIFVIIMVNRALTALILLRSN